MVCCHSKTNVRKGRTSQNGNYLCFLLHVCMFTEWSNKGQTYYVAMVWMYPLQILRQKF